jgi:type III pantothenate kinase
MIRSSSPVDASKPVIVVDIGNTTIGIGTWQAGNLRTPLSVPTGDTSAFEEAYAQHAATCPKGRPAATIIAAVVPEALNWVREFAERTTEREALVVGENLPLPMDVSVEDARAVGVDRVCTAAVVFDRLKTGCTVVMFGTAVTVDLIDDEGSLLGGAILPGLRMQLRALHEHTAALPEVRPGVPEKPYGRNTTEAIQTGVCRGIAGAVRGIVEGYATSLNRWPQVVATGGDAEFMAPLCDFIDTLVAHLTLRGVGLAYGKHLAAKGVW